MMNKADLDHLLEVAVAKALGVKVSPKNTSAHKPRRRLDIRV